MGILDRLFGNKPAPAAPAGTQLADAIRKARMGTISIGDMLAQLLAGTAGWVLRALPPDHGLLVNPGTDFCFDWPRPGIEGYLAKFNL